MKSNRLIKRNSIATRESQILEAVKALISQLSIEEITVREVAKLAGVTTPTLYNRFGSKDALIAAALNSYYRQQVDTTLQASQYQQREIYKQVFEIAELYCQACVQQPHFVTALMTLHYKIGKDSPIQMVYQDNCATFRSILDAMDRARELRSDVNKAFLATALTETCYMVALQWCQGKISKATLENRMNLRCAMVLSCFTKISISKLLQDRIDQLSQKE